MRMMKSTSYLSLAATIIGLITLFGCEVECSSLVKSPWSNDLNGLLSMLLGFETERSDFKFDRKTHDWVKDCPETDCKHGIDEGDSETCPYCLLGPGESCSDWKGECGEDLACQYKSAYSSSGKCVPMSEFNSRKVGETCGNWEGNCKDGLKCLVEQDSLAFFCGLEESGVCVTEEQFSSREEGDTCGDTAGNCKEGLECVDSDYCWFTSVCRNLTNEEKSNHHEHVISIEEVIHSTDAEDGTPDKHITFELVTDGDDDEDEEIIDEMLESELFNPIIGSDSREEVEEIEKFVHSVMTKSNATNEVNARMDQNTTKIIENKEKHEVKTIVIKRDSAKSNFHPIVFDAQSDAKNDDEIELSQPSVNIL